MSNGNGLFSDDEDTFICNRDFIFQDRGRVFY